MNPSLYELKQSSIPHVTCISLAERLDRRKCIDSHLRPHFPNLVVFDAVDVTTVSSDICSRMKVMPKARKGARERKSACWESHVAVLEGAISSGSFPHIVLEDDIYIPGVVDVPFDTLPLDSICMLAGSFNGATVKEMGAFVKERRAEKLASTMPPGINALQKDRYRISSSAAYFVPTETVAVQLVKELREKKSITHYDIDLFMSPHVKNLWFPSPFATYEETAVVSDIMPSQTILFSTEYIPMKRNASRKRCRDESEQN